MTTTARNRRLILPLFAAYVLLLLTVLAAGTAGLKVVDAMRAYAMGESFYAKGQEGAVAALYRYARSRDPADFAAYRRQIAVPANDRRAREVLEDGTRPAAESYVFLEQGNNHPSDVATIAWFFRLFDGTALLREPLEIWRQADARIAALDATAQALRRAVESGNASQAAIDARLRELDALDQEFTALGLAFTESMGATARWVTTALQLGMGGLGAALALVAAGFTLRTKRRMDVAAAESRLSEAWFRDVAELATDWVWETDAEHRIKDLSERVEQATGLPRDAFLGRRRWELDAQPCDSDWPSHIAALERRERLEGFEYCFTHVTGATHTLRISGKPVFAPDGKFLGYRGIGSDVTRRRQAENARREAEERLWAFLDGSPEVIALKDLDGRYLLCNRGFERLTGLHRDEVIGRTDGDLFSRHAAFWDSIEVQTQRVLATGAPVSEKRDEPDADGNIRTFACTKFPIFDATGTVVGIGATNRDITELKSAEVKLRHALKMQAVGELTGGVAHDFNNLLAVVLGNLELLRERLADDDALAAMADQAIAAARRGATTTRRLLAFSRQQPLRPQAVDVGALLESMSGLLRQSLGRTIELDLRIQPALRACCADPAELETALLNLAVNARDAMPEGGRLTIEARNDWNDADAALAEGGPRAGPCVRLSVSDTGCGMSAEVLSRACEPFFTTKSPDSGSGLGLSMVYGFARQSDGHVSIRSKPGAGTTVRLYLPQAAEDESEARRRAAAAAAPRGAEQATTAGERRAGAPANDGSARATRLRA